jgi:hypothetical protein
MIHLTPADGLQKPTVEFGEPPTGPEAEAVRARQERARRNSQWLQTHWQELLPRALGKFVAVAGEEAFVADTPQQIKERGKERGRISNHTNSEIRMI